MRESVWQVLFDGLHKELLLAINTLVKKILIKHIDAKINAYNAKLMTEGPMSFINYKFGQKFPINATMTKAPEFRHTDQIIELHMDGRFIDPVLLKALVGENSIWQPREITAP